MVSRRSNRLGEAGGWKRHWARPERFSPSHQSFARAIPVRPSPHPRTCPAPKPATVLDLYRIKQGPEETLCHYIWRFWGVIDCIPLADLQEISVIAVFHANVRNPMMREKLRTRTVASLEELCTARALLSFPPEQCKSDPRARALGMARALLSFLPEQCKSSARAIPVRKSRGPGRLAGGQAHLRVPASVQAERISLPAPAGSS